jgi:hypothetical protein
MHVPFAEISPASRIWIFQADRPMTAEEMNMAETKLLDFTERWAAHGQPLKTSFSIRYNQFIILAADEGHQNASGCSIDSSVRTLKEIEETAGIQLLARNLVAFMIKDQVLQVPLTALKEKFREGILKEDTLTFDNLINTRGQLEAAWLIPAGKSWVKRYIPGEMAKLK